MIVHIINIHSFHLNCSDKNIVSLFYYLKNSIFFDNSIKLRHELTKLVCHSHQWRSVRLHGSTICITCSSRELSSWVLNHSVLDKSILHSIKWNPTHFSPPYVWRISIWMSEFAAGRPLDSKPFEMLPGTVETIRALEIGKQSIQFGKESYRLWT